MWHSFCHCIPFLMLRHRAGRKAVSTMEFWHRQDGHCHSLTYQLHVEKSGFTRALLVSQCRRTSSGAGEPALQPYIPSPCSSYAEGDTSAGPLALGRPEDPPPFLSRGHDRTRIWPSCCTTEVWSERTGFGRLERAEHRLSARLALVRADRPVASDDSGPHRRPSPIHWPTICSLKNV